MIENSTQCFSPDAGPFCRNLDDYLSLSALRKFRSDCRSRLGQFHSGGKYFLKCEAEFFAIGTDFECFLRPRWIVLLLRSRHAAFFRRAPDFALLTIRFPAAAPRSVSLHARCV